MYVRVHQRQSIKDGGCHVAVVERKLILLASLNDKSESFDVSNHHLVALSSVAEDHPRIGYDKFDRSNTAQQDDLTDNQTP